MIQIAAFIENNIALYIILSVLDTFCAVGTCAILTETIFGLRLKKKPVAIILSVILCLFHGVIRVFYETGRIGGIDWSTTIGFFLPYVCMTMLFFSNKVWKSYIAVLSINITFAVKYLILMGMPDYDYSNPKLSFEFLIDFVIDVFTFAVLLAVFILYVHKYRKEDNDFSQHLPLMIVLIVLTTFLFVASMIIMGTNFSPEKRQAYLISLLCFPAFAATVVYSTRTVIKSSIAENGYRKMLDMQLRHFMLLDRKNDELRMFRHDFPKQMAPLLMYIKEGNTTEAEKIVNSFNVSVQNTKSRFNTGNPQLDTVLECEQQIASKHNIKIDVVQGSVFPAEGISGDAIYTIFPNALDNAIEACASLENDAVISFESHINGSMAFVRITNPFDGNLKIGSGGLKTRKKDKENHGFGVRSMQKAMSAYGSDNLTYETKNGRITLNLVFNLN